MSQTDGFDWRTWQNMKRTDPAFAPKALGHSTLSEMVRTYPDLLLAQEGGGYWVGLRPRQEGADAP